MQATAQVAVTLSSLRLGRSQLLPSWASLGDESGDSGDRQGEGLGRTVSCFVTPGLSEALRLRVGCSPRLCLLVNPL